MKAIGTAQARLRPLRFVFGLLALTAIAWQLGVQIRLGHSVVNFFSYFTNLSNQFAAVVLLLGACEGHTRRKRLPDWVRAATAVNMIVVGMVFAILLRDADLGSLLPPRSQLATSQILVALLFPILYLAYVLLRGSQWHSSSRAGQSWRWGTDYAGRE